MEGPTEPSLNRLAEERQRSGAARPTESPALRLLAAETALTGLLVLRRSQACDDPLILQASLGCLRENPSALLQDSLLALGERERLFLSFEGAPENRPLAFFARSQGIRSLLILPMERPARGSAGCFLACYPDDRKPAPPAVARLEAIARATGNAMGTAASGGSPVGSEAHLAAWIACELSLLEAKLVRESRGAALFTLTRAIRELCGNRDADTRLRKILSLAIRLIAPAEAGGLLFARDGVLRVRAMEGVSAEGAAGIALRPGESIPGKAYAKKKPLRVVTRAAVLASTAGLSPENRKAFLRLFEKKGVPTSVIAAPVMVRGVPAGAIVLDSFSDTRTFGDADLPLLQQFANLAAAVFEADRISDQAELRAFLLDQVHDAVVAHDVESRIRFSNAGAARLWGWKEAPTSLHAMFAPDSSAFLQAAIMEALASKHWSGELRALRADGSTVPVLASISSLSSEKDLSFVAIFSDLSDRTRLHALTVQAAQMEGAASLAGNLAHDFNNVLGVIQGYASLAREKIEPGNPIAEEMEGIQRAAEGAGELAQRLLAFSRAGKTAEPRESDLEEAVEGCLELLRTTLGPRIALRLDKDRELPKVRCDPEKLRDVLLQLALNSREAMPREGTFRISLSSVPRGRALAPSGLKPARWALVGISDTGGGMSQEVLSRVFEPFFTTKESRPGAGLGCAIAYSLVRSMGGWIEAESAPGQGAAFQIFLPSE